jgi:hypothetical protein
MVEMLFVYSTCLPVLIYNGWQYETAKTAVEK